MRTRLHIGAIGIVALLTLAAAPGRAVAPQADFGRVFVTVLSGDKPVVGLSAADFVVREDGDERRIVSAEPATAPLAFSLLTDRFGGDTAFNLFDMREALDAVVQTIKQASPDATIDLMTFDGAATEVVKPTTSLTELRNAIKSLAPQSPIDVFLEALDGTCRQLAGTTTPRRVVFAVLAGYKPEVSGNSSATAGAALVASRASLWVIEGINDVSAAPGREDLFNVSAQRSGGLHETVRVGTALPGRAKWMAGLIASQYEVIYAAPAASARVLQVGVTGKAPKKSTVLAPSWIGR